VKDASGQKLASDARRGPNTSILIHYLKDHQKEQIMTLEQTGMLIIVASFLVSFLLAWRGTQKENDTH
jgi:hypothetical protein